MGIPSMSQVLDTPLKFNHEGCPLKNRVWMTNTVLLGRWSSACTHGFQEQHNRCYRYTFIHLTSHPFSWSVSGALAFCPPNEAHTSRRGTCQAGSLGPPDTEQNRRMITVLARPHPQAYLHALDVLPHRAAITTDHVAIVVSESTHTTSHIVSIILILASFRHLLTRPSSRLSANSLQYSNRF